MNDLSEFHQLEWESAVAELFEIINKNIDHVECNKSISTRKLDFVQFDSTAYFKLCTEAFSARVDTVPFCEKYDISTFRIFLEGYRMLHGNPCHVNATNASLSFMDAVRFVYTNRPHTWYNVGSYSSTRFLMYVFIIGHMYDDPIILSWPDYFSFIQLGTELAKHLVDVHTTLGFLEIYDFHSYTNDSFSKLIEFISNFSRTDQHRLLISQYVQNVFSSRKQTSG